MKADVVTIRNDGAFVAEICLDAIPRFSTRAWTALMKILAYENPSANNMAIVMLDIWFPAAIRDAEDEWGEKSREFQRGYRDTKLLPRGQKTAVKARNDRLFAAVKAAKAQYDKLAKRYEIYKAARADADAW